MNRGSSMDVVWHVIRICNTYYVRNELRYSRFHRTFLWLSVITLIHLRFLKFHWFSPISHYSFFISRTIHFLLCLTLVRNANLYLNWAILLFSLHAFAHPVTAQTCPAYGFCYYFYVGTNGNI